jgi:integrase
MLADDPRHRGALFTWIAMETASRKRAIEELRWDQVDLQARLIRLNPPGRRQTSKRRPTVPISSALMKVLERAGPATGLVLGNSSSIERPFATLCRAAHRTTGNEKFLTITPHVLRHTWATLAARAGVSLFEIAGVLGDSIATVQRVYAHHCPDYLRSAVEFRAR